MLERNLAFSIPEGIAMSRRLLQSDGFSRGRVVAKGYQDPDPQDGIVDTSGYVSPLPPHLQVISLRAIKKMVALKPGRRECVPASGWLCIGCFTPVADRMGFVARQPGMETQTARLRLE